jgi:hypothetical protein
MFLKLSALKSTKLKQQATSHQAKACQINLKNLEIYTFMYLSWQKLKLT